MRWHSCRVGERSEQVALCHYFSVNAFAGGHQKNCINGKGLVGRTRRWCIRVWNPLDGIV